MGNSIKTHPLRRVSLNTLLEEYLLRDVSLQLLGEVIVGKLLPPNVSFHSRSMIYSGLRTECSLVRTIPEITSYPRRSDSAKNGLLVNYSSIFNETLDLFFSRLAIDRFRSSPDFHSFTVFQLPCLFSFNCNCFTFAWKCLSLTAS